MSTPVSASVYETLTSEDDGRVCRDIPETACQEQPGNFLKHVLSLAATKTGDGFADPKLVLSWLLSTLGAPAFAIGLLVPVREAGALLPQLVIAGWIRSLQRRKWVWAVGSLVQGLAVLGMAFSAVRLEGSAAGWAILALLALWMIGLATGGGPSEAALATILGGPYTAAFWTMVVALGLLAPLLGEWLEFRHGAVPGRGTAVLVLVGGFALRWILVFAGQASGWATEIAMR